MSKKAVIQNGSSQYIVSVGDTIAIDQKLEEKTIEFDALLVIDGTSTQVGQPTIDKVKVKAKLIDPDYKAEKVTIVKFKPKKRYLKRQGHRQQYTLVEITAIA
ncbi:50S ribosomal protein L21 [Candidatus Saccharibacteria bacterium]|nr:50S ribosomal protein L21 [Candidatus Saccharibacteria bacterium]